MNRFQKDQAFKSLQRSQDIQVSTNTKNQIESIAVAHFAAGNMTEFAVGMNTLGKIDTQNEILSQIDQLAGAVRALQTQQKA